MLKTNIVPKDELPIRYSAFDNDNIPRAWGCGPTHEEAKEQCKLALNEYLNKKQGHLHFYFRNKNHQIKLDPYKVGDLVYGKEK